MSRKVKLRYSGHFIALLKYTLMASAVLYVIAWVVIACQRIGYPYELEVGEGDLVGQVSRILSGKRLYVAPSLEFTPYLYAPMYFYVSAIFAKVMGLGFSPLRLVSFLASVGCMAIIFQFVWRETKSAFFGMISVGLFAATYCLNNAWFEIADVDSLFMLFLMGGIYVLRNSVSIRSIVIAAILIFLAFITKQSAGFIAIALSLYCFVAHRGWARYLFPATFVGLVAISTAIMSLISEGWYYFYIFVLPNQHGIEHFHLLGFWRHDLLPLFIAFAVAFMPIIFHYKRKNRNDALFFALLLFAMMMTAWLSRLHVGGGLNVLMPAHAVLSMLFGIGLYTLSESQKQLPRLKYIGLFALFLCGLQFISLAYKPQRYLPSQAHLEDRNSFINLLRGIEGDVFMSYAALLPTLAGKTRYTDGGAFHDILRSTNSELKKKLKGVVREAILSKRFQALIVGGHWLKFYSDSPDFVSEVKKLYIDKGPAVEHMSVFHHANGRKSKPARLLVLRQQ